LTEEPRERAKVRRKANARRRGPGRNTALTPSSVSKHSGIDSANVRGK